MSLPERYVQAVSGEVIQEADDRVVYPADGNVVSVCVTERRLVLTISDRYMDPVADVPDEDSIEWEEAVLTPDEADAVADHLRAAARRVRQEADPS